MGVADLLPLAYIPASIVVGCWLGRRQKKNVEPVITHEHIGDWEQHKDGSQTRRCIVCNFLETIKSGRCEVPADHTWGKWEDQRILVGNEGENGQGRVCETCGLRQLRRTTGKATP